MKDIKFDNSSEKKSHLRTNYEDVSGDSTSNKKKSSRSVENENALDFYASLDKSQDKSGSLKTNNNNRKDKKGSGKKKVQFDDNSLSASYTMTSAERMTNKKQNETDYSNASKTDNKLFG